MFLVVGVIDWSLIVGYLTFLLVLLLLLQPKPISFTNICSMFCSCMVICWYLELLLLLYELVLTVMLVARSDEVR